MIFLGPQHLFNFQLPQIFSLLVVEKVQLSLRLLVAQITQLSHSESFTIPQGSCSNPVHNTDLYKF